MPTQIRMAFEETFKLIMLAMMRDPDLAKAMLGKDVTGDKSNNEIILTLSHTHVLNVNSVVNEILLTACAKVVQRIMAYKWWPLFLPSSQSIALFVYNELQLSFEFSKDDDAIAKAFRQLIVPTIPLTKKSLTFAYNNAVLKRLQKENPDFQNDIVEPREVGRM